MSWDDEVGAGAPETQRVAVDSGAQWMLGSSVELAAWPITPLHEDLKRCVGRSVTLHCGPGIAAMGKLEGYDEKAGICLVDDGIDVMTVRADAVLIISEKTRSRR